MESAVAGNPTNREAYEAGRNLADQIAIITAAYGVVNPSVTLADDVGRVAGAGKGPLPRGPLDRTGQKAANAEYTAGKAANAEYPTTGAKAAGESAYSPGAGTTSQGSAAGSWKNSSGNKSSGKSTNSGQTSGNGVASGQSNSSVTSAGQRYVPPPKVIEGITGLQRAKPKTPISGGGGLRKRWVDRKGNIYEWDYQHGMLEKYNKLKTI